MKKGVPFLILGVLLISGLSAVASPDDTQEAITYTFSNITAQEHTDYTTITLSGTNDELIRPHHYIVPTYTETYTYPFGTKIEQVHVEASDLKTITLPKPLKTTPAPVIIGTEITMETTEEHQAITTWYDYDVGTGIIDNHRQTILKLETYPAQYNPDTNQLTYAQTIKVRVTPSDPDYQQTLMEDYDFLVLCADEFSDELAPFVSHKDSRGIATKLVTLTEIYSGTYFPATGRDSQEKIKYFIKDAIENWGIYNVLLVGGSLKFPVRKAYINAAPSDKNAIIADLYYADIYNETQGFASWDTNNNDLFGEYDWNGATDDLDLYPDVYFGRLACVNSNEVTAAVNKIITYEDNEAYTLPWFSDLVTIGGDSFPGDDDGVYEGEVVNEAVINRMSGFIPQRLWASNGKLSGYVPTGVVNINNALNSGAGWVDFSGHGNTNVYATHPPEDEHTWLPTPTGGYLNSHIASLSNGNKLPIVITGACSVGKFDVDPDCFSWSFVSNPNGGGIASFGATHLGWAYIGNGVTQGLIEGMCLDMFKAYTQGATTTGIMWANAVTDYIRPGMQGTDYKTVEEWQSFSDPTTAIGAESEPPLKPTDLAGPTNGNYQQTHIFTASTTDPESDKIYYLFDWGDGTFSGWVGPYNSGETGSAQHKWSEQGSFSVRVKAKDDQGSQSEWSDPLPITLPNSYTPQPRWIQLIHNILNHFPYIQEILQQRPIINTLLQL